MEVTKTNFPEVLKLFKELLPQVFYSKLILYFIKAELVSFDLEFSGLQMKYPEDKFDTFYERYIKVRYFSSNLISSRQEFQQTNSKSSKWVSSSSSKRPRTSMRHIHLISTRSPGWKEESATVLKFKQNPSTSSKRTQWISINGSRKEFRISIGNRLMTWKRSCIRRFRLTIWSLLMSGKRSRRRILLKIFVIELKVKMKTSQRTSHIR